jgi:hypothetical protein
VHVTLAFHVIERMKLINEAFDLPDTIRYPLLSFMRDKVFDLIFLSFCSGTAKRSRVQELRRPGQLLPILIHEFERDEPKQSERQNLTLTGRV